MSLLALLRPGFVSRSGGFVVVGPPQQLSSVSAILVGSLALIPGAPWAGRGPISQSRCRRSGSPVATCQQGRSPGQVGELVTLTTVVTFEARVRRRAMYTESATTVSSTSSFPVRITQASPVSFTTQVTMSGWQWLQQSTSSPSPGNDGGRPVLSDWCRRFSEVCRDRVTSADEARNTAVVWQAHH